LSAATRPESIVIITVGLIIAIKPDYIPDTPSELITTLRSESNTVA
jgi:hypothetical protein